jgi:hypothetical protein
LRRRERKKDQGNSSLNSIRGERLGQQQFESNSRRGEKRKDQVAIELELKERKEKDQGNNISS